MRGGEWERGRGRVGVDWRRCDKAEEIIDWADILEEETETGKVW